MSEPTVEREVKPMSLLQAQPQPLRQCRRCGVDFEPQVIDLAGIVNITTMICSACSRAIEQEQDQADAIRRQSEIKTRHNLFETHWCKWCPREFRLTTEGNGNTELAKLELRQPKVNELVHWKLGDKGWLIRGDTGSCKTRSIWRLVRRLHVEGRSIIFLTATEFHHQCLCASGKFEVDAWSKRLVECDVFILDDLGSGAWTNNTEAEFFHVIDKRSINGRATFATTQHTGDSLKEQTEDDTKKHLRTEALIRRLREYCTPVVFE